MPIPQQHECNPDVPAEAFVWALVGLPGPRNGPLLVPPQVLEKWSEHLWQVGLRHHPEHQTREYHPAPGGEHWLGQTGQWVPTGTPKPPELTMPSVADLTVAERRHLVDQLRESGELAHLVDRRELEPDHATEGRYSGGDHDQS
jgi:hypothetical protein